MMMKMVVMVLVVMFIGIGKTMVLWFCAEMLVNVWRYRSWGLKH